MQTLCDRKGKEEEEEFKYITDLRPDGYAIHQKSKRLAILEFTRARDSSEDGEVKKDAEKLE